MTCLSLGIRNSWEAPSGSVITRRCLPLVSLPKDTVPVYSASTPASLGDRASKSSATRGRPPVMSRVLADSWGMRASTSPTLTSWPSFTVMSATEPLPGDAADVGLPGRGPVERDVADDDVLFRYEGRIGRRMDD